MKAIKGFVAAIIGATRETSKAAKSTEAVGTIISHGGGKALQIVVPLPFADLKRPAGDWIASGITFSTGTPGFTVPGIKVEGLSASLNVQGPSLAKGEKSQAAIQRGVDEALAALGLTPDDIKRARAQKAAGKAGVTRIKAGASGKDLAKVAALDDEDEDMDDDDDDDQ